MVRRHKPRVHCSNNYFDVCGHQDGRVVKALDLRSNGCVVRVGSNPTPGNFVNNFNRIKQHEKRTNKFCFVSYCFCCSCSV